MACSIMRGRPYIQSQRRLSEPLQYSHGNFFAETESQFFIKPGGNFIHYMEKWHLASCDDRSSHHRGQRAAVTASTIIRMSATRTYFTKTGQMQPFTSHGHQLPILADS